MSGWIKLHRKLLKSNMYKCLNCVQRDVMIQCLLKANHETNQWKWGNKIYKCEPGQFVTSLKSLKKVCAKDVSIQNIRTALVWLEKWEFLTNTSTKTGRLITICKWETYQKQENQTNKHPNKGLTKDQQRTNKGLTTNKKYKNVKNVKKKNSAFSTKEKFEQIWSTYPKKVGKKAAYRHFKASVKGDKDFRNINLALKHYKSSKTVMKGFVQNGSTWFNNWQDWVEMPGTENVCPKCKGRGIYKSKSPRGSFDVICDCPAGEQHK